MFRNLGRTRSRPAGARPAPRPARNIWLRWFGGRAARISAAALICLAVSCGDNGERPTEQVTAGQAISDGGSWERLADGSYYRIAETGMDGPKIERCWQSEGTYDCLLVEELHPPQGRVVAVSRKSGSELPAALGTPPLTGFSCAIYPSGIIEQRVIGSEGELLRNDSTDGQLWNAAGAGSLLARGEGEPEGRYIDCAALNASLKNALPEAVRTADRRALGVLSRRD